MPGLFAARALVGGRNTVTNTAVVMTSEDLATWSEATGVPGTDVSRVSVAGDTYFAATGVSGAASNYAWSTDGDTFTAGGSGPVLHAVTSTGTYFVNLATGATATQATAATGAWSTFAVGGSAAAGRRITYNASRVVACVQAGDTTTPGSPPIFYSDDDGATWTTVSGQFLYDLQYGNGVYVATVLRPAANLDQWVRRSADGATWASVDTGLDDQIVYTVQYGNGRWVGVGRDNTDPAGRAYTSDDNGLTWTQHTSVGLPTSGIAQASQLAFWAGKFVWVNPGSGSVWTSTNGESWTETVFADRAWTCVAAGFARPSGRRGLGLIRG